MAISTNTSKSIVTFTEHADEYILKIEKNELKAVKKGLWTWFSSSVLNRKEYQLSTVLDYIKQNKEALDESDRSERFYRLMQVKLRRSKITTITDSLKVFINTLHSPKPLNKDQIFFTGSIQFPSSVANSNGVFKRICNIFVKSDSFVNIFKQFNEAKDGLLAQLVADAKKNWPFSREDDQACQAYLKFISSKLSAYAQEFGGIDLIPTSEKFSLHYSHYQEIATWIENKRLVTFFENHDEAFHNGSEIEWFRVSKQEPLEEQAETVRQFFKTCLIEDLNLSNQGLTYIIPEISLLSNLKTIDLSNNQLTAIPQEWSQLASLKILNLSHNQLTEVPQKWSELASLQELDLSDNQIIEKTKFGSNVSVFYKKK